MSSIAEACDKLIGLSIEINGEDYGRIMRWVTVEKDDYTYHVLITSTGRKVEAVTLLNYIKTKIHYPDGTDYVMRQRKIKPKRQGKPAFPSSISTKVYFRGQTGDTKTNRKATS